MPWLRLLTVGIYGPLGRGLSSEELQEFQEPSAPGHASEFDLECRMTKSDISLRNVLLIYHPLIPRYHGVEDVLLTGPGAFRFDKSVPAHLLCRLYLVIFQFAVQPVIDRFIQKQPHGTLFQWPVQAKLTTGSIQPCAGSRVIDIGSPSGLPRLPKSNNVNHGILRRIWAIR